jgi:halimadienyl-diphosphate synthase
VYDQDSFRDSNEMFMQIPHLNQLGIGTVLPTAYDTAWLARVPAVPNLAQPAFPGALNWLREHQLSDGSWGTLQPYNAHSNTLSTLAAILALLHWNNGDDNSRIRQGMSSLLALAQRLEEETFVTIGFELLLPALVKECEARGLVLPADIRAYYQPYEKMSEQKKRLIELYHQQYGFNKPASWWFSLEMLGGTILKDTTVAFPFDSTMLSPTGSIAASPAATAFLLAAVRYRGGDLPDAYYYLNHFSNENITAAPDVFPIDEFELAFSANYLLEAGVNPEESQLKEIMHKIYAKWQARPEGGLGYSSHFFIDPDCTANGIMALIRAGYKDLKSDILLRYFNGSYIETYEGELIPSVSSNLHSLCALRLLPQTPEIKNAINKILDWLNGQAKLEGPLFIDKWHFSPIYPISRAVIALEGLDNALAERCIEWLCQHQHDNGGWGELGYITQEETAFASLALRYWQSKKHSIPSVIFEAAQQYMESTGPSNEPLWIGKVLYCPYYVVASVIAAAMIGLAKKDDIPSRTIHFDLGVIQLSENLRLAGTLYCLKTLEKNLPDISLVEEHNRKWALETKLCEPTSKMLNAGVAAGCARALRNVGLNELNIYTDYALLLLSLDDVLDEAWEKMNDSLVLSKVFTLFLDIIKNKKIDPDCYRNISFPRLHSFCEAFTSLKTRIYEQGMDVGYFISSVEMMFEALYKEFSYRQKNIEFDSDEYLNFRIQAGSLEVSCELAFLLKQIVLNSALRQHPHFIKFKAHGYRAFIIANDILSMRKEQYNNESTKDNYIFIKQQKLKCSLSQAFEEAIKDHNQEITMMIENKRILLSEIRDDQYLEDAMSVVEDHVQAHLDWALETIRYQRS